MVPCGRAFECSGVCNPAELERSTLKPVPSERFTHAERAWAKVSIDYHVEIERSYYSVPYRPVGRRLAAHISASTVEIFDQGERVAAHARSMRRGKYTTEPADMPSSHRKRREWSPSRLIAWAAKVGPSTAALVEAILADRPHPEQGYRSCLGIMRLARGYGVLRREDSAFWRRSGPRLVKLVVDVVRGQRQ
jgi:transposase